MPDRFTTRLARSAPTGTPGQDREDERVERQPSAPAPHMPKHDGCKRDGAGNLTWDDEEGR